MFEKVNPSHPDKVADRIAGALVDLAYKKDSNPKIAVEVLVGHGKCHIIAETSVHFEVAEVTEIAIRIAGAVVVDYCEVPQDEHLAKNQDGIVKCGDNGIFKGVPVSEEERWLTDVAKDIYKAFPFDGKYVFADGNLTICQSNADDQGVFDVVLNSLVVLNPLDEGDSVDINPLGYWTGGSDVDTGATNRKLGSDMAQSVTGGGIHGKDLSKADVSVNIFAFAMAQLTGKTLEFHCAIGDDNIDGIPYSSIVGFAKGYVEQIGGFEKLAEWGLVR